MFLENIVFDAADPRAAGLYWQDLLGCEQLTDTEEGFETRWAVPSGPVFDLCFPRVEPVRRSRQRVVLGLVAAGLPDSGDAAEGTVHSDPEGNTFTLAGGSPRQIQEAPLQLRTIRLESSDPGRDTQFWAGLSGWQIDQPGKLTALRHPTGQGPRLEFVAESEAKGKGEKNPVHLDLRLESGDDPLVVAERIAAAGGRELPSQWGSLPWRIYQDPSGNEFCVLPAPGAAQEESD
ncbi:VOC family protein [Arthrobacter sp. LS16]|uniref:VOC family protein n=1 Tax=Arthrobacter sp. 'calajunan' TaxID=1690248 RepID=UPI003C75461A